MEVVDREQAAKEVEAFLDYRKVTENGRKLPDVAAVTEGLIRAISEGHLSLAEDFVFIQKLQTPLGAIEKGEGTKELKFSPRFTIGAYHKMLQRVDKGDQLGVTIAKLAVLSGQPKELIEKLANDDYEVASLIAVFF